MKVIILQDSLGDVVNYEMLLNDLDIQVLGIFSSWIDAKPTIEQDPPDFFIIDSLVANKDIVLNLLREHNDSKFPLILCWDYPESDKIEGALDAGVIAFIPPPIDKAGLTFHIQKLANKLKSETPDFIIVKDKKKLLRIPYNRICKVEIMGNYSFLFLEPQKKYALKRSLIRIMEQLDPSIFIRCHRSTVVNVNYFGSIDLAKNKLYLTNNTTVHIGSSYKKNIRLVFNAR